MSPILTHGRGTRSSGVNVPGIRMVDATEGILGIEWIDGKSVRFLLGGGAEGEAVVEEDFDEVEDEEPPEEDPLQEYGISQGSLHMLCSLFKYMPERLA